MKSYWYIETDFLEGSLWPMIVSQEGEDVYVSVFSNTAGGLNFHPAFKIEWELIHGVWNKMEEVAYINLPDDLISKLIELSYVESYRITYPPGFTEQMF